MYGAQVAHVRVYIKGLGYYMYESWLEFDGIINII